MANIFDTAKYILMRLGPTSTMKLQKLCYYAQAWSLVWDKAPLFAEDFEAWESGPVCPELYEKTKGRHMVNVFDTYGGEQDLSVNQKDTIDAIMEHYGEKNAQWLSQLTKTEDPWINAKRNASGGSGRPDIISKESMQEYYSRL